MKKTLLIALVVALFSCVAPAADDMPPSLFETTGMDKAKGGRRAASRAEPRDNGPVVSTALSDCDPEPSPACPPAPVLSCGHAAPSACSATTACGTASYVVKEVPVRKVVEETKLVPVKRRVVEEEVYLAHEKRTGTYSEPRTRTARRTVEVPATKMVSEAKILAVKPDYGTATRLARGVNRKVVVTTRKEVQEYEESYTAQVKYDYTVPVTKTRKVAKTVEEYKAVPVRKTVTTTETRLVPVR